MYIHEAVAKKYEDDSDLSSTLHQRVHISRSPSDAVTCRCAQVTHSLAFVPLGLLALFSLLSASPWSFTQCTAARSLIEMAACHPLKLFMIKRDQSANDEILDVEDE